MRKSGYDCTYHTKPNGGFYDYVRIDTPTKFMYIGNDVLKVYRCYYYTCTFTSTYFSKWEIVRKQFPRSYRATKKRTIPIDKKVGIWYTKEKVKGD